MKHMTSLITRKHLRIQDPEMVREGGRWEMGGDGNGSPFSTLHKIVERCRSRCEGAQEWLEFQRWKRGDRLLWRLRIRDRTDEVVLFSVGLQKGLCTMQSSTAALDVSAVTLNCWHVIIPWSGPEYFTVLPRAPLIDYDLNMM